MPIGGFVPPVSGGATWSLYMLSLNPSLSHDFIFSKTAGTWNTTTVTVANCWDNTPLPSTVSTPFTWANGTSSFTVSVPAGTNIGNAVYSITPAAPGVLTDFNNSMCYVEPQFMSPGVTYTITYTFSHSLCSNIQGTFVVTKGNNSPVLSVNSPTICPGDPATLTATGGTSYTWTPGGITGPSIVVSPTVNTTYTVTGSGGCAGTSNVISSVTVNQCLVWPGDANNDLTATNADLLPLGVYFNQKGIPRVGASNNWVGQNCVDWGINQTSGADVKFADCNGDSTIEFNDTLAIHLNFGLNHPAKQGSQQIVQAANPDAFFVFDKPQYIIGDTVRADLHIGSVTNVQSNFYGSAFEIDYDPSIIVPGSEKFWYWNSWVGGINQSKITFSKINSGIGKIYAALVKTTHNDTSGYGRVATLQFVLSNTITPQQLYLTVLNGTKINNVGTDNSLISGTDSVSIVSGSTEVNLLSLDKAGIYPNPNNGTFLLDIPLVAGTAYSIQIQNSLGQVVYFERVGSKTTSSKRNISMPDKTRGLYFLVIQSGEKRVVRKIVVE